MITVRLTENRVSNGHLMYEGETLELPDDEAWRLIQAGQAEEAEPRAATLAPARSMVLDRPKQKTMRGSKDAFHS